jgi:hypothetical protein
MDGNRHFIHYYIRKKITPEEVLNPFEDQKDFIFILPTHYT